MVDDDKIFQRQGEVFTSDVREVKVVLAASVLNNHQCLELIDVGHIVALCREREREKILANELHQILVLT